MDEELNIQDYLKSLLDGEQSPDYDSEKWYYLYHINKYTNLEIGEIHCYTIKLFHSLKHYFSESSQVDMIPRIDFREEYKIIDELIVDYVERGNPTIANFISAKEINKEDPLYCTYDSLYHNVIEAKDISRYDVNYYEAIAYNDTFKLKLYLFKDKVSQWSFYDIRYKYYELTLPKRIEKYRIDLEKACTKKEIDTNLEIISFYINKFNSFSSESSDKNISLCYGLIKEKLEELHHRLNEYFAVGRNKKTYNKKLEWNDSIERFTEFFDSLISSKSISYKESNDAFPIYKYLLLHFDFSQIEGGVNIGNIIRASSHTFNTNLEIDPDIKLSYNLSRELFASTFSEILNTSLPDKSSILYEGECNIAAIAIRLHKIFEIISKKRPYTEITPGSLNKAFIKALNSN